MSSSSGGVAELLVLRAVAAHPELGKLLVLKGAHAVEALTGISRATRDLDLTTRNASGTAGRDQATYYKHAFYQALETYLEDHHDDWTVYTTSADPRPSARPHRFGWDGFLVKVNLQHLRKGQHVVEIDLSFGDCTDGVVSLAWPGGTPRIQPGETPGALACYSHEQAIAEKLRAWLQKLPPNLQKVGGYVDLQLLRVRDLHDLHLLLAHDGLDWGLLGRCFVEKCRARFVDCRGIADLLPPELELDYVRALYISETSLNAVPFENAWDSVQKLVQALESNGHLPGEVPLPEQS